MLFHYALEATNDNWLHDVLQQIIIAGMNEVDAGQALSEWPACIPAQHLATLAPRTGLRDRRITFLNSFEALGQPSRDLVRNALSIQNNIPGIFDGVSPWVRLEELPAGIREPAKDLFRFAFGLLTDLGLRDQHYRLIWQNITRAKICPFCGLERLKHPNQPRQDLDHYLPISLYPFAGANLRNLAPMGGDCNTAFKGQVDVVFNASANIRRRCSDPYTGPIFSVSLDNSVIFGVGGAILPRPTWNITLQPDLHGCATTWDSVFQVKRRYSDVLSEEYRGWIEHFARWCADDRSAVNLTDIHSLKAAIANYRDTVLHEGLADTNFLKQAVFEMIGGKLETDPNADRLAEWLMFLVAEFVPAAAA